MILQAQDIKGDYCQGTVKGGKPLHGRFVSIYISVKLPAGQRCTHRPHRWEEGGEVAVAGTDAMETSTVRFFCLGKRKEPWALSSSDAQGMLCAEGAPLSRLCHPARCHQRKPGNSWRQPPAPCREDKVKTPFLFVHATELGDKRRQGHPWTPNPLVTSDIFHGTTCHIT